MRLKYVTNYSNDEHVTKSSTVPDWLVWNCLRWDESEANDPFYADYLHLLHGFMHLTHDSNGNGIGIMCRGHCTTVHVKE